jgi:predicted amidohydrolase
VSRESVRVGIHQAEPGSGIEPGALARYLEAGVRVLVFPEYFWARPADRDHRDTALHSEEDLAVLQETSRAGDWLVVGGTIVERRDDGRFHNACPVFHRGKEVARYRKVHVMPGEARHGIVPGDGHTVVDSIGVRIAPIICADVLYPDTFARVAKEGADLIVAPMSSPFRPDDTPLAKDARDREIFLEGARRAKASIVKAGGVGRLFGRPLQGRSLVATPREILFRTPYEAEDQSHAWIVDVPLGG